MKISIEEPLPGAEEEVIIRCHKLSPAAMQLIAELKTPALLVGQKGGEIHMLAPHEVYYCETVDSRTFLYTQSDVFETKLRLYELDDALGSAFLRISKSVVLNMGRVRSLRPAISGRFEALLDNKETVVVSRQYVPALKEALGL